MSYSSRKHPHGRQRQPERYCFPAPPVAWCQPEQFIAFALSTCFNATIRIVQHREGTAEDSQLRTRVDIVRDKIGYKFIVDAQILMPSHTREEAQKIVTQALDECPVAKLLKENENVTFRIVDEFTDERTLGE